MGCVYFHGKLDSTSNLKMSHDDRCTPSNGTALLFDLVLEAAMSRTIPAGIGCTPDRVQPFR